MTHRRTGFTLLEMLLTLAMSVVLMILISGAINFYARDMENAENQFRQTQLAASILQMIENDLRMALVTRPVDTAALAEVLAAASAPLDAMTGMSSGEMSSGGDADMASLPPADGATESSLATDSFDAMTSIGVLQSPGLIGNANQLQIDISRLPNLEAYAIDPTLVPIDASGGLNDRPSDLKTVSYFVVPPGGVGPRDAIDELVAAAGAQSGTTPTESASRGGLVRRQLDRVISNHAAMTGGLSRLTASGDLIASEITQIQFEYFDGITWLIQYNSDELGYLPMAIRVTITMSDPNESVPTDAIATGGATTGRTFAHLVHLPFSHPEDADAMMDESMSDSTSSSDTVTAPAGGPPDA